MPDERLNWFCGFLPISHLLVLPLLDKWACNCRFGFFRDSQVELYRAAMRGWNHIFWKIPTREWLQKRETLIKRFWSKLPSYISSIHNITALSRVMAEIAGLALTIVAAADLCFKWVASRHLLSIARLPNTDQIWWDSCQDMRSFQRRRGWAKRTSSALRESLETHDHATRLYQADLERPGRWT